MNLRIRSGKGGRGLDHLKVGIRPDPGLSQVVLEQCRAMIIICRRGECFRQHGRVRQHAIRRLPRTRQGLDRYLGQQAENAARRRTPTQFLIMETRHTTNYGPELRQRCRPEVICMQYS